MSLQREAPGILIDAGVTTGLRPKPNIRQKIGHFSVTKPLGAFGAAVAITLILVAIFAPVIATHDPYTTSVDSIYAQPGAEHLFGGDHLGRDVFSRIIYGARISVYLGLMSSIIGCSIGMIVGIASVQFGGLVDLTVQRFIDAMIAFPTLILAIAIMAALGASVNNVVIALSIVYIPSTARII